uniref:Uncharacterized protein LOC111116503 n=1 Tax=Crassostrea virginica TaxID=6565 RepID=A0A8B8C8V7_CRAVI|nr:uncharacterized protein LOC111116503 [Crassostrea virginica]
MFYGRPLKEEQMSQDDLSYNKDASQSHTASGTGYGAENAVDGNTATCTRTKEIGRNSPDKTVWWKVDLGGVYNIYSVNILFKNTPGYESRLRGRFAGFSLYISNTRDRTSSSLCYKDGPELPPLNFTTTCTLSGRYVIFYNERLDGVTYPAGYEVEANIYTELCEVIVNECSDGAYGYGCVNNCSGHCVNSSSCNKETGHCDRGCKPGYTNASCGKACNNSYGENCQYLCDPICVNQTCDRFDGTCQRACNDDASKSCGVDDSALSDEPDEPDDSAPVLPERNMRGPPSNKNIPIRNIKAQIANMSAKENAGFKYEYNVKEMCPKPKTIADFWTMVSQEEVTVIVCLTNLKEGAKNKCAQYWPNVNDKLQGGNITIRNLGEKTYAEHIIRQFKIHNKAKGEDRLVTMYHYTAWADHGVADPLSLVVFHRQVMKATAQSNGNAGVGRTGTYIALDALYREGRKSGKINVPMYVRTMRKDRMNMIQGDEQYKLLYLALMEAFNGPSRCLATEKFLRKYQDENCYTNCGDVRPNPTQKFSLSTEFEELLALKKVYSNKDYELGQTHLSANYTQNENNDMRITVLECPTWKERQSTADKRVLLDVIKEVKTEKINTEGRILVLSSDGATRCGPFFVVYNALEQITVDREVDIFTIARQLQVRRTEFVSTLDEYQLCYDVIAEYLLNDCVYGNV